MNDTPFDIDLTDASGSGVFFVTAEDLPPLAQSAHKAGLALARLSLLGCHNKQELLDRLAVALQLPSDFGRNWDALADSVRDLGWLNAPGYLLQFEHADDLQDADEEEFNTLLDILDQAAASWSDEDIPFFAFFALPADAFAADDDNEDAIPTVGPAIAGDGQSLIFDLDRDHVELNQLLKLVGLCDSGGAGKAIVASGAVTVNGEQELRKTRKIHAGDRVQVAGVEIVVRAAG